jgi:hypothetical protein
MPCVLSQVARGLTARGSGGNHDLSHDCPPGLAQAGGGNAHIWKKLSTPCREVQAYPAGMQITMADDGYCSAFVIAATRSFEPDPQREMDPIACVNGTSSACTRSRLRM